MDEGSSSILKSLLSAGGEALGGYLHYKGSKEANVANAEAAQKQMDFQERMSSSAFTRARHDMSNAGLNPILAVNSPASSPGGSMSSSQNPFEAAHLSSARAAKMLSLEFDQVASDTALKKAQALLAASQADQVAVNTASAKNSSIVRSAATPFLEDLRDSVLNGYSKIKNMWLKYGGSHSAKR